MNKQTSTYEALKYLEEKFGIEYYNEICRVISEQQEKIRTLTKQRDNWKNKYNKLKEFVK